MWWVVSFLPTLGTEFSPLEPRPSVQPHEALLWYPLDSLTCLVDSMSHIVCALFGHMHENVCEKVHGIQVGKRGRGGLG
jgi:hypothetical protein